MGNTNTSADMGLPIPVSGVDPGPDYSLNVNACFTLIDAHDHSSGKGVPITPSGLAINSDLPFLGNNATLLRSARFSPQVSPLSGASDLGCLYESGVDLYYNDGSGNQVRITQSGGVAGSPGSIASLTSPASATYVSASSTFVWQSAASTPANMDGAAVLMRNLTAGSNALTLTPPNAMGSNYTITLPSLPASTLFLTMDSSGNMGTASSIAATQIAAGAITGSQIANNTITRTNEAAVGQQTSASCGNFSTGSSTPVAVTNLSVTLTTSGRPVIVMIQSDQSSNPAYVIVNNSRAQILIFSNANRIANYQVGLTGTGTGALNIPASFMCIDIETAGTYTYTVEAFVNTGGGISIENCILVAYEL